MAKTVMRWVALPAGVVIFLLGAVLLPLPIPLGLIFMVVGLAVATYNPLMLRYMKKFRRRHPQTNRQLRRIAPHMPSFVQRFLRRTDTVKKKRDSVGKTVAKGADAQGMAE